MIAVPPPWKIIKAIGNQTILGTDCKAMTSEPSVSSANFERAKIIPNTVPIIRANTNPIPIRCKLVNNAVAKIPVSKKPL